MAPQLVDDRLKPLAHGLELGQVLEERVLGADRFADAVGAHRPLVDAARDANNSTGRTFRTAPARNASDCARRSAPVWMPSRFIFAVGRRADAVEFADRQRLDEGRPHPRRDDEQPVRLAVVGGELGEELVVGHAGRGGEAGLGADPARGSPRRSAWPTRSALQVLGDVEIGLVERQRLDQRRVFGEDGADLRARPSV